MSTTVYYIEAEQLLPFLTDFLSGSYIANDNEMLNYLTSPFQRTNKTVLHVTF